MTAKDAQDPLQPSGASADAMPMSRCADDPPFNFAEAPCLGAADLFFTEQGNGWKVAGQKAKRVCHSCRFEAACLEWALESSATIDAGIFGGTNSTERRKLARARGITHGGKGGIPVQSMRITLDEGWTQVGEFVNPGGIGDRDRGYYTWDHGPLPDRGDEDE